MNNPVEIVLVANDLQQLEKRAFCEIMIKQYLLVQAFYHLYQTFKSRSEI